MLAPGDPIFPKNNNHTFISLTCPETGPDPQTESWVGHCAFVLETGLATQHWSGKSEGCA